MTSTDLNCKWRKTKLPTSKRRTKGLFVHREGADVKIINGLSLLFHPGWRKKLGKSPTSLGAFIAGKMTNGGFRYLVHWALYNRPYIDKLPQKKCFIHQFLCWIPSSQLRHWSVCLGKLSYFPKLKVMFDTFEMSLPCWNMRDAPGMLHRDMGDLASLAIESIEIPKRADC